ncbi:zinc finger protein 260-like isoform X2 [Ostrinia furnacalis]|uniref:zinc finger protein 260-like isoform X2 n=1 Tax=Ostrinia furnacalis TaxID=93504 RepID=UPI00103E9B4A|nr:zinc finger protein 260-like isoform X2 [Ostrinia furnacalis]
MAYIVCKMTKINVCRICLVQEFQEACLLPKANKQLEIIYEKFTNKPFKTEDGRPSSVCRICCHLLLKCQRFVESAVKADEKLQQLWSSGVEITEQSLSTIDRKFVFASFTRSPVSTTNVTAENTVEIQVEVKREGEKLSGDVIEEDPTDTQTSTRQSDWVKLKTEKPPSGDPLQLADVHEENVFDIKIENYVDESDVSENSNFVKCGPQNEEERATMSASPVRLRHECAACCRGFESASELYQHNRDHDESSAEFECAACHIRCRTAADLKRHEDVDHQRYPGDSLYGKSKPKGLAKHTTTPENTSSKEKARARNQAPHAINIDTIKIEPSVGPYPKRNNRRNTILKTPKKESNSTSIPKGLIINSKNPRFSCEICGKHFLHKSVATRHIYTHSANKPHSCEYCEKTFAQKGALVNHARIHTGEKPFSCMYCKKTFTGKAACKYHEKLHTGEKPFSCDTCGKKFPQKSTLNSHVKIHSGEKPYSCEICGRAFVLKANLTCHVRSHTGEKLFSCDICGKSFARKFHLLEHTTSHTGEKPFSCDFCAKAFAAKSILKIHLRIHTGEKPYTCRYCGKSFIQNGKLKVHERMHTGEKPYACEYCPKTFLLKLGLDTHRRTHTGEKPFPCPICGKYFSDRSVVARHKKLHADKLPFSCDHCGKSFSTKRDVTRHINTHTNERRPHVKKQNAFKNEFKTDEFTVKS